MADPVYSWELRESVAQPRVVRVCQPVRRSAVRLWVWDGGEWFSIDWYEPDEYSLARSHVYLGGNSGLIVDRPGPLLNFPSLVGYD